MKALLEAYLFVAAEPVRPEEIAPLLDTDPTEIEHVLDELAWEYETRGGLRIIRIAGGFQMATRPDLSQEIARLLAAPTGKQRLSKPALETVAIIAYRQPATQAEIEAVRGVNVDAVLKTLEERRLIKDVGRKPVPGRPILYGTTPEFLHYFGLNKLDDLPPLEEEIEDPEKDAIIHAVAEAVGLEEVEHPHPTPPLLGAGGPGAEEQHAAEAG
ncbi:MAG TPA: SMC-Scp complex subunit ScpB [Capsulimonadaceae bacterium]|nr:SMC-Scp complex subunit ScpB [Capsulimonadaceae bacterium]